MDKGKMWKGPVLTDDFSEWEFMEQKISGGTYLITNELGVVISSVL